jgi:hypothetical protein
MGNKEQRCHDEGISGTVSLSRQALSLSTVKFAAPSAIISLIHGTM